MNSNLQPASAPPGNDSDVNFKLWSKDRIRAYSDSLGAAKRKAIAVLTINRLEIKAPVFTGTDDLTLNRGVGWIQGTSAPGGPENSGIAGHRDSFFRPLKDVVVGDAVELQTRDARLTYRVDQVEIVGPEDVNVLRPRGAASITLVTCYPFYFVGDAPLRFIVHARLEKQQAAGWVRNDGPS